MNEIYTNAHKKKVPNHFQQLHQHLIKPQSSEQLLGVW